MRTTIALLLLTVFTLSLPAQSWWNTSRVKGNGDVQSEQRDVDGFTGVHACCSFKVQLTQAEDYSMRVEAESNLLPLVETEVRGGTLRLKMKENSNVKTNEPIHIYVSLPKLEELSASSSSRVRGTNTFTGEDFSLSVSSSASVDLAYEGDDVEVQVSSSGRVELTGRADEIEAKVSSAGSLDGKDFSTREATLRASSAGNMSMGVTERINARANSAGSIKYHGNPNHVDTDTSSAGRVSGRN